ncbi:MAG TPA: phage holin family protein [Gaiellaceae bacterium]|jgi:hypothetical protein|nr:phage holin family protein [Gaiellaceae bacterium]
MPTLATEPRPELPPDSGLGPVAREVVDHASTLARLEVRLALLELKQKLAALGLGIGLAVGAGIVALYTLGFALAAVAAGIATAVSTWLALLIVAVVLLAVTGALALLGMRVLKRAVPPMPEQAIEEAKRTTAAMRTDGDRPD